MIRRSKVKNSNQMKVTFALPDTHPHKPEAVVGDFNNWDPAAHPLKLRSNKTFSCTVTLDRDQRYAFRYRCEGEQWYDDEEADEYEPNEFGSQNSILLT